MTKIGASLLTVNTHIITTLSTQLVNNQQLTVVTMVTTRNMDYSEKRSKSTDSLIL